MVCGGCQNRSSSTTGCSCSPGHYLTEISSTTVRVLLSSTWPTPAYSFVNTSFVHPLQHLALLHQHHVFLPAASPERLLTSDLLRSRSPLRHIHHQLVVHAAGGYGKHRRCQVGYVRAAVIGDRSTRVLMLVLFCSRCSVPGTGYQSNQEFALLRFDLQAGALEAEGLLSPTSTWLIYSTIT